MNKYYCLLLGLLLQPGFAQAENEISFREQVLPILMRECAYCHMREESYGYLVIEDENSWHNLTGVPAYELPSMKRVEPGDPDNSYVWLKLTRQHLEAGGSGWMMPFHPLSKPDLGVIYSWIEQGARNN